MELRHLRYFAAVAEHASMRAASERLHITQPAITRQIQDLEAELGFTLFTRSPRGLRLTPAGDSYLRDARRILAALDAAATAARRVADGVAGQLRLGYVENAGWDGVVPQALHRFQAEAPDVAMALSTLNSPEQLAAIAQDALDGGFIYRFDPLPDDLAALPLLSHDIVLALPRAWRIAHDEAQPFDLHALAGRPFVSFPRAVYPAYHDRLFSACQQAGIRLNIVQEQPTEAAMLSLVCSGIGAAIVNAANLARPPAQVRFYRLQNLSVPLPLCFVWQRQAGNPALARFVETLRETVRVAEA
ncbi:LysR family transcriptional regulator [Chromobacterium sp. ATCC 53434]|uniref:LysR family transcriptional regulator n=1 Tax=Chromobacterium sp. (strain ATCC 53434 / SC 14030) TaxID=2059672 RepID=UPI000C75F052|nr:LysR family transcriptional regulator [Chromobacterium sp. ATCC 53434]AUH52911.1 LysR family transcriptional regulator [Chromobacterium sp. ATCC 53434]